MELLRAWLMKINLGAAAKEKSDESIQKHQQKSSGNSPAGSPLEQHAGRDKATYDADNTGHP